MPQFDVITLGTQFFGSFCSLVLYYAFTIILLLPSSVQIEKFRSKKIVESRMLLLNVKKELKKTLCLTNVKYNYLFK